uniref:Nuclear receptor n=1 Tax=Panagrellus redivivus TaxID=6233 RepID=A0A7E4USC5_PANRE
MSIGATTATTSPVHISVSGSSNDVNPFGFSASANVDDVSNYLAFNGTDQNAPAFAAYASPMQQQQSVTDTPGPSSVLTPTSSDSTALCAVCGDTGAKPHYTVLACLGCKGFFRRALKKVDQHECLHENNCVIDRYGRTSCRACRLKKCLEVGMDPSAVRPDRDFIGKTASLRPPKKTKTDSTTSTAITKEPPPAPSSPPKNSEDYVKKLPVYMRIIMMNLKNMEVEISRGDTMKEPHQIYPLYVTIRELVENPGKLKGKRTEMRYEPYRMAKNEELSMIVYRRVIAAIDWVEMLAEMIEGLSDDDKIALVKSCYAPLLLFMCSARTAMVTQNEDILCLCNFAFVPRNIAKAYSDTYHLDNNLVERLITDLVKPFREISITEEEVVCLSAIIVLNPMAKDLSPEGIEKVSNLRDKVQETLFQYIKESRSTSNATSLFGNFLLSIPKLSKLATSLCENIRFALTFSSLGRFPLLLSVFGCFPVEPFLDTPASGASSVICKNAEVQTENTQVNLGPTGTKQRLPSSFVSPVENEESSRGSREFCFFRPPGSYTLTEMFDDRMNDDARFKRPTTTFQRPRPYPKRPISHKAQNVSKLTDDHTPDVLPSSSSASSFNSTPIGFPPPRTLVYETHSTASINSIASSDSGYYINSQSDIYPGIATPFSNQQ